MRYLRLKRRHKFPNCLVNFVFGGRTCMYDAWIGEKFIYEMKFMKGPAYHIYHSTDFV